MGTIFVVAILIFSVIVHEISHGYAALLLGDLTAKDAGRLTLNPIKHIDLFGSILFPLLMSFAHLPVVGWAKPVPYNPLNLYKDYKYGPLKVALAGPFSNLCLAGVFIIAARLAIGTLPALTLGFFGVVAFINISLALFNLVPIPPLDGSTILTFILPRRYALMLEGMGMGGIILVLVFVYFLSGYLAVATEYLFNLTAGYEVASLTYNALNVLFQ